MIHTSKALTDYLIAQDIAFAYGEERVLHNISFSVAAGELVMLTGENGAAKSTLLRILLGLLKPASGQVIRATHNVQQQLLQVGYVPQQIAAFNSGFPSTVYDFVASGRFQCNRWFRKLDADDREHIERALVAVGMTALRHRKIGELSGGQKQRVCLARVFATDPDLFVLDEPTTGMDRQSRARFYDLLKHQCHVHKKAVLMVTHEDQALERLADQHIQLVREEDSLWRCFAMNSCKSRM